MRKSLRLHYQRIDISALQNLPLTGPNIIAATHPNSFLDAIVCAAFCHRKLYFLARSDVFKFAITDYLLKGLNLIPIYRASEGKDQLGKNAETFEQCHAILEKGGAILIFAEGISIADKQLRPLKKGIARIAFGVEEKNGFHLDVNILPLGINYEKIKSYHNQLWLRYGHKTNLKALQSKYLENKNAAFLKLNRSLFHQIEELSIISEQEDILDLTLEFFPELGFKEIQLLSNKLNSIEGEDFKTLERLSQQALSLKKIHKLERIILEKEASRANKVAMHWMFWIAFIYSFIPLFISRAICNQWVKSVEFYDSFRVVLNTLLTIVWSIVSTAFLMIKFHFLFLILPFIVFQFAGVNHSYFKLKYYNRLKRIPLIKKQLVEIKSEFERILK